MSGDARFIPFIHILRGLAPLIVVWSHLAGGWFMVNSSPLPVWNWYAVLVLNPLRLYQGGGHFGVVLFFLISGYIISHVAMQESRLDFVAKRVFRLMPVLFVAVALAGILAALSGAIGFPKMLYDDAVSVRDYVVSAFFLDYVIDRKPLALPLRWSLGAEIVFYAVVAALIPLIQRRPVASTWTMSAVAAALVVPWQFSGALSYGCYFSIYLPLFIIGRIFYLEHTQQIDGRDTLLMTIANVGLFCLLYSFRWPGQLTEGPAEPIVTYFIAIVLFYAVMRAPIKIVPAPIRFFADISYSLYLVHLPIGSFTIAAAMAIGAPRMAALIAGLAAAVSVATIVSQYVERPCQRLGRQLLGTLPRQADAPSEAVSSA